MSSKSVAAFLVLVILELINCFSDFKSVADLQSHIQYLGYVCKIWELVNYIRNVKQVSGGLSTNDFGANYSVEQEWK